MPPDKKYSSAEVMGMNRAARRRIGAINKVKIPGIQDKPIYKPEHDPDEMQTISKILAERNPINPRLLAKLKKQNEKNRLQK